jgi:RNA polymerase sigma-70 factor (ECF subfamily)
MFVVCQRYARCKEDAEDILMEGFMDVFKNLKTFRGESSFDRWITSIMIKKAVSYYRSVKRFRQEESWEGMEETLSVDEDEAILAPLSAKMLVEVLERMPDSLRTTFNLRAIDGFSFEEISDMLGKKENALRISYMRARKWLMSALDEQKK